VTAAPAPLAGLRVLDIASLYAGPLVATLLADHGADVVKVEPPAGDVYRTWPAMWALVGRRKRSLTLDLAVPEGASLLVRLLPSVDVVVENLPPSVGEARGLTPAALRAANPSLVVVSASGFGHDGPYADRPANGTVGEAMAGLTHLTGDADGAPVLPSVPLGDVVAAAFGAMGALAAVLRQVRGGVGAHVDLTVFEPILHVLGPALTAYRSGDEAPSRDGGAMGVALRGTFRTEDGGWVAISCSTPRHLSSVADLVGGQESDPLRDRASAWISRHALDDVLDALVGARVPVAPVNDLAAIVADPHIGSRGSLISSGEGMVAAPAPRIDGNAASEPFTVPALGDANDDVLRGILGLGDDDIAGLRDRSVV
jgi:crotonobetainyl-CoA:carnitine CoA-transferase CaiB-like acyl-CoA transferase